VSSVFSQRYKILDISYNPSSKNKNRKRNRTKLNVLKRIKFNNIARLVRHKYKPSKNPPPPPPPPIPPNVYWHNREWEPVDRRDASSCEPSRRRRPETAPGSDGALRRAAVSVIGGPGLAVRTAASVKTALHGTHPAHPHGLVECVAFVLEGRQVEIYKMESQVNILSGEVGKLARM
jgi:hypothetical protein